MGRDRKIHDKMHECIGKDNLQATTCIRRNKTTNRCRTLTEMVCRKKDCTFYCDERTAAAEKVLYALDHYSEIMIKS